MNIFACLKKLTPNLFWETGFPFQIGKIYVFLIKFLNTSE